MKSLLSSVASNPNLYVEVKDGKSYSIISSTLQMFYTIILTLRTRTIF